VDIHFSDDFDKVVSYARDEAMRTGHRTITVDHLLLGLLREKKNDGVRCLQELGVDIDSLKRSVDSLLFRDDAVAWSEYDDVRLGMDAQSVIGLAMVDAGLYGDSLTRPLHLLSAICRTANCFSGSILSDRGITTDRIKEFARVSGMVYDSAGKQVTPAANEIAEALERELRDAISEGKVKPVYLS